MDRSRRRREVFHSADFNADVASASSDRSVEADMGGAGGDWSSEKEEHARKASFADLGAAAPADRSLALAHASASAALALMASSAAFAAAAALSASAVAWHKKRSIRS
eukprot:scaffold18489_cov32-Tisochrysis_lutea.AAC.4